MRKCFKTKKFKLLVAAAVLIFTFWNVAQYAIPRQLGNRVSDVEWIGITYSELTVTDNRPNLNGNDFEFTADNPQFQRIIDVFDKYLYYGDYAKEMPTGQGGGELLLIVTDTGFGMTINTETSKIKIGEKVYRMASKQETTRFINDIKAIVGIN